MQKRSEKEDEKGRVRWEKEQGGGVDKGNMGLCGCHMYY